jgi:aminopeptidase-like protein
MVVKGDTKMAGYFAETGHDSYRFLKQLDPENNEPSMAMKEIRLRFSERQYEILKSFDGLGLKEKLNIMYAVIDFIVKQIKNGVDI